MPEACYQTVAIARPGGRRDSWIAAVEGRILSPAFATSAVVAAVAVASERTEHLSSSVVERTGCTSPVVGSMQQSGLKMRRNEFTEQ